MDPVLENRIVLGGSSLLDVALLRHAGKFIDANRDPVMNVDASRKHGWNIGPTPAIKHEGRLTGPHQVAFKNACGSVLGL